MNGLIWCAAAGGAGLAWSIFGALAAALEGALPTGAAQPPWSSAAALLGAALGAGGARVYQQRGWHPGWRTLEWLAGGALLALRLVLAGGQCGQGGGAECTPFWAAAPVLQGMVGWWAGAHLARSAVRVAAGLPWQSAYRTLLADLFLCLALFAGSWALASFFTPGAAPVAASRLAVAGGLLFIVTAFIYLAVAYHHSLQERFKAQDVAIDPSLASGPSRGLFAAAGLIVVAAAFVPGSAAPFPLRHFGRWMEWFTDRVVGPLLVPKHSPGRFIGEEVRRISVDAALAGLARRGAANPMEALLELMMWTGVLVLVLFVGWRLFRVGRRWVAGPGGGPLLWGIGWLLGQVRAWFVAVLRRFGFLLGKERGAELKAPAAAPRDEVRRRRRALLDSIPAVYRYVLERLAARGIARRPHETPHEFLARWRAVTERREDGAFDQLTQAYVEVRYQERGGDAAALRKARAAAARVLRGWTRAMLAARLAAWARRRYQ